MLTPEQREQNAQALYEKLKSRLAHHKINAALHDHKRLVSYKADVMGCPIDFTVLVNAQDQCLKLYAMLPMTVKPEKSTDMAMAVCIRNSHVNLGHFDYDVKNRFVGYMLQHCFYSADLDDELIDVLIGNAYEWVRANYSRFLALNAGYLTLEQFAAEIESTKTSDNKN